MREKLRAALKEESDAWVPVLRKQGSLALDLSSDGPSPDELVRLKVARRRADDAATALEKFIAARRAEQG